MTPQQRYNALYEYLLVMLHQRDWHGVRDVCVDIEVLLARHPEIKTEE